MDGRRFGNGRESSFFIEVVFGLDLDLDLDFVYEIFTFQSID